VSYSYSAIKLYEQCPLKYKLTRIDHLVEPSGDAANRGKTIHAEIEAILKGGLNLLSDDIKHLEEKLSNWIKVNGQSELPVGINDKWEPVDFNAEDVMFRGIIDLFIKEESGRATVLDFKTGKHRDYSDQVSVYSTVILSTMPDVDTVENVIEFIDLAKTDKYKPVTRSDLPRLQLQLKGRITAIEKDKIYAPNPSVLCKWCHFRKSNGGPCKW
jgi:CRISPR/Cas system-associated exonuclease Cas4 (RecB family)